RSVRWVIVDEVHSVAGTKRGSHLALSLERLENLNREVQEGAAPPGRADGGARDPSREAPLIQRIGLSATQRPLDEIGRFLGGSTRSVTLVDAGRRKQLDLEVVVPLEDMSHPDQVENARGGSVLGPE